MLLLQGLIVLLIGGDHMLSSEKDQLHTTSKSWHENKWGGGDWSCCRATGNPSQNSSWLLSVVEMWCGRSWNLMPDDIGIYDPWLLDMAPEFRIVTSKGFIKRKMGDPHNIFWQLETETAVLGSVLFTNKYDEKAAGIITVLSVWYQNKKKRSLPFLYT